MGVPVGMMLKEVEHDSKVSGKWKYTMLMPDGKLFISEGKYLVIIPYKEIVTMKISDQ
jgi:hypothetical protein